MRMEIREYQECINAPDHENCLKIAPHIFQTAAVLGASVLHPGLVIMLASRYP